MSNDELVVSISELIHECGLAASGDAHDSDNDIFWPGYKVSITLSRLLMTHGQTHTRSSIVRLRVMTLSVRPRPKQSMSTMFWQGCRYEDSYREWVASRTNHTIRNKPQKDFSSWKVGQCCS